MHPVIVSHIRDKELAWKQITDLNRLNEDAKVIEKDVVHRVRVSVIATGLAGTTTPDSLKNFVRIYDKKTGKSRQADAKSALKGKNEHFVFTLPIYVKDSTTRHSAKVNILHIVDDAEDANGGFFPGISIPDLLKNKAAQAKAMAALDHLTKFNVYLEASVQVSPDGHMFITNDTHLKAY